MREELDLPLTLADFQAAATGVLSAEAVADAVTGAPASEAVAQYALGLGDDALILAHRLGEWVAGAPALEEDVALTNIGLDLLGHARSLLTYAGSAWNKTEDDLAYFRQESEFRCLWITELPIGNFADTIARQLIVSAYFVALYEALEHSSDDMLSAIAAKAVKEVRYHLDHSAQWVLRLALGTELSREKMTAAIEQVWPYVEELFADDPAAASAGAAAVEPSSLREPASQMIQTVLTESDLAVPTPAAARGGGRSGVHTEFLGPLLAEMQVLARQHPGATW